MMRAILSVAILIAGAGASQAQMACYPRIGAYSGQYEGQCPQPNQKWTVVENTIGAFGRNCSDEPWTFNRSERMFYHPRANETFPMQDCEALTRDQVMRHMRVNIGSETVRRFHESKIESPAEKSRARTAP